MAAIRNIFISTKLRVTHFAVKRNSRAREYRPRFHDEIARTSRFATQMMKSNEEIKQQILNVLRAPKYRPLARVDLAKVLGRKSGVRMGLNQALRELEQSGEIARIRQNRYVLPEAADLVTGTLQVHQAGYAFLV